MVEAQSPFATVARKIGNPRLEKVLALLAANIAMEAQSAERIPKRSEVRDNLKLLKGEARRFEKALSKISLLDISFSAIECLGGGGGQDFVQHLSEAWRAEKAG